MCMLDKIHARRDEIRAIARKHKAERLWVFGSVARKEERPDSDIDFLVEFGKTATLFDHGRLYNSLNAIFSQGVDVIDRGGVREGSPFTRMIEKDLVAVRTLIRITIRRRRLRTFSRRSLQSRRALAVSPTNNSLPTGKNGKAWPMTSR